MQLGSHGDLLRSERSRSRSGSWCPGIGKGKAHPPREAVYEEISVEIHQTPSLKQKAEYSALVAQTDQTLRATVNGASAVATWDLAADDRGRPLLVLRLRDDLNGQASAAFAPDELQSMRHLESRLHKLKGALVQVGHWREQLRLLFENLRLWCQALPRGADVQEELITIREERSGEYEVSRLVIRSDGQVMWVEPVALWIVGADGRVDLEGVGGPFTLLYSQQDGAWVFLRETPPLATFPLTQQLFLQLAEACLHG
jgi:hypothetical protein